MGVRCNLEVEESASGLSGNYGSDGEKDDKIRVRGRNTNEDEPPEKRDQKRSRESNLS